LVGAGGIRSTANDMLKFAAAALDPDSPIAAAMTTALANPVDSGNPRAMQALGWQVVNPEPGREVWSHGGGTGGFRTQLAIEPSSGRAAIVLVNSAVEPSAGDIAYHLVVGSPVAPTPPVPPAPPPPVQRTAIDLTEQQLDRVVGSYDFGNGVVFRVWRDGAALKAQREGGVTGPEMQIFPEAPLSFFWRAVDAQIGFTTDDAGNVTGATFAQGGPTLTGRKIVP
jgi:D-alanyl-D-alanine-carboxypeptidase/D-alanyl-D-alanine-endopeptidase